MGLLMMSFRGVEIFVTTSPQGIEQVETECGKYDLTDLIVGDVYDELLKIVAKKEAEAAESDFYYMVRGNV